MCKNFFEQEDSKKSLFISLAVILVLNPYAIFDISMQLSYMAVAAIIFVYPPVEKLCEIKFLGNMKTRTCKGYRKTHVTEFNHTDYEVFHFFLTIILINFRYFSFLLNIVGVPLRDNFDKVLFLLHYVIYFI